MGSILRFCSEALPAFLPIVTVYGFGIAFFLFISQTETYNRVAWFIKKDGDKHAWLALFNTSRRYLLCDHIYNGHLNIDPKGAKLSRTKTIGDVKTKVQTDLDGSIRVDIDYMDRKTALIVELCSEEPMGDVQLHGIVKDGRLLKSNYKWDNRLHSPLFNILVYIVAPAISIAIILWILYRLGKPCGALWLYGIGMAGLPLGIYLYFRKHRRIFSEVLKEVKKVMSDV